MYNPRKVDEEPPNHKWQRAVKRTRGKQHNEQTLEPGEHHQRAAGISKRRLALSIEDTETQICGYFDPN